MRHAQTLCLSSCHPLRVTPVGSSSTLEIETVIDCKPEHLNCPQIRFMWLRSCFLLCCLILKIVAKLDFFKWKNMPENVDFPVTSGKCQQLELSGVSWSPQALLLSHSRPRPCQKHRASPERGLLCTRCLVTWRRLVTAFREVTVRTLRGQAATSGRASVTAMCLCVAVRVQRAPEGSRVLTAVPLHGFLTWLCIGKEAGGHWLVPFVWPPPEAVSRLLKSWCRVLPASPAGRKWALHLGLIAPWDCALPAEPAAADRRIVISP